MKEITYHGEGYSTVLTAGEWRVGMLRYSDRFAALTGWERHRETHECFILLSGQGSMLVRGEDGKIEKTEMKRNVIYDVLPGEWHHIIVSPDATVLIIENADTSSQNTDKCSAEGGDCGC